MSKLLIVLLTFSSITFCQDVPTEWLTRAERTNFRETTRYDETIEFCRKLEKASPWIKLSYFGKSGEGRDIPLVVASKDKIFDAKKSHRSNKTTIIVLNGIHPGEIEGKDASLMLLRDIVVTKKLSNLLDNVMLLVIPIFNVDGHERFGPYNRINQNGPEQMGWRTNANNLNLNRDFMKADAPETRALLELFNAWLPALIIDIHTTNGADYQYAITYSIDNYENVAPTIRNWINEKFLNIVLPKFERSGHHIAPYIWFKDNKDPQKGMYGGTYAPRLSNTYFPLQNRPALLIETHMLKDYETRVRSTYDFLKVIFEYFAEDNSSLKKAVKIADDQTISGLGNPFPLSFENISGADTINYLGYEAVIETSKVSGGEWIQWTDKVCNVKIPWFNKIKVKNSVIPPFAYLIPQQWKNIINILKYHGIKIERLKHPIEVKVERYRFSNPKWQERPYEGRHPVSYDVEKFQESVKYPIGTFLVRLNQRSAKVAIHLLEPEAPDALVAWGYFDAIFEQKEYADDYVLEKLAREMLAKDTELKKEFEEKLLSDSTFAKSPSARLNFFYQKSPYWDPQLNLYPVTRVLTEEKFVTESVK